MNLNVAAFLETLPVMLYGMLGIFVVMLVIFLLIGLFGRLSARKPGEKA